jgi:transcriptional regulator GlxA family with amidase domain
MDPELAIKKTIELMTSNLSQPVRMEEIAAKVGCSYSFIRRIFKKLTGKSIVSHLIQLRLEKAKALLQTTNLTATEIAFEVGFSSYAHFEATFKKKGGQLPCIF